MIVHLTFYGVLFSAAFFPFLQLCSSLAGAGCECPSMQLYQVLLELRKAKVLEADLLQENFNQIFTVKRESLLLMCFNSWLIVLIILDVFLIFRFLLLYLILSEHSCKWYRDEIYITTSFWDSSWVSSVIGWNSEIIFLKHSVILPVHIFQ